jgi:hypothetical protein
LLNFLDAKKSLKERYLYKNGFLEISRKLGPKIQYIEDYAKRMKLKPIIFSKDNNYLIDELKSKKFRDLIKFNSLQL